MLSFRVDSTEVFLVEVIHSDLVPRVVRVAGTVVPTTIGLRLNQIGAAVQSAVASNPGATHALVVRQDYGVGLGGLSVAVRVGQPYTAADVQVA